MKQCITILSLGLFLFAVTPSKAQDINPNSAFTLPPSIFKTLQKEIKTCLLNEEDCIAVKSLSSLTNSDLDFYFGDYSENASVYYETVKSYADNLQNTIQGYKGQIENVQIKNINYRYGHSSNVKLADVDIYLFKDEKHAEIVKATFLISSDDSIYAVMIND